MKRKRGSRGSALITALALVAITALMLTGVCILATSHSSRQKREADYALALQLADAGINYELRWVSTHLGSSPAGHLSNSPYTGSIPGVAGTFTVYVTNADGTTNWATPSDMKVTSTGTVGGITRKVTAICKTTGGKSIFAADAYDAPFALFGYTAVTFSGASSAINGNLGSNGAITVKSNGNGTINGNVYLCGAFASVPNDNSVPNRSVIRLANAIAWPTIDTIVAATFANGWSTLSSASQISAQSARMRTYATNSPVLTVAGTKLAGLTNVSSLSNNMFNSLNVNTLILPPGDYYFTDIQISGQSKIICDTAAITVPGGTPGPVRIWMNGNTSQDTINADVSFTSSNNPAMFRLYYNKAADLSLAGNLTYYGGIYGVRAGASTVVTPASITIAGGGKINGAVIADTVKLTGGGVVTAASSDMTNTLDYKVGAGPYGFAHSWTEVVANTGGTVFSDGTNH